MKLDDLLSLPEDLIERAFRAVEERRRQRYVKSSTEAAERIAKADHGNGDFKDEELVYAAHSRCDCGAGMAYPEHVGMHGAWHCSAILKGQASREVPHTAPMPFAFWSVRSESQLARNNGYVTTRPSGAPIGEYMRKSFESENKRRAEHQPTSPQLVIPEVAP